MTTLGAFLKKKRREEAGALRKKALVVFAESIQLVTFYVNQSDNLCTADKHRDNDLRASRAEGRKPAGVFLNVSNTHDRFCGNGSAAEPAGGRESRECGRRRAGTSDHGNLRGSDFVESDPTIVAFGRDPIGDSLGRQGTARILAKNRLQDSERAVFHHHASRCETISCGVAELSDRRSRLRLASESARGPWCHQ